MTFVSIFSLPETKHWDIVSQRCTFFPATTVFIILLFVCSVVSTVYLQWRLWFKHLICENIVLTFLVVCFVHPASIWCCHCYQTRFWTLFWRLCFPLLTPHKMSASESAVPSTSVTRALIWILNLWTINQKFYVDSKRLICSVVSLWNQPCRDFSELFLKP